MSIWSELDSAFGNAAQDLANDATGVVSSLLSGVDVRVKTNVTPEFSVGGLSSPPAQAGAPATAPPAPGLFDLFGLKYSVRVLDAGGNQLFSAGSPPDTNYALVAVYVTVAAGLGYVFYRGLRAMVRGA